MTEWVSADEAMSLVQSGARVFVHGGLCTPTPLIEALVARGDDLRDVEITHLHTYGPAPYTDAQWRGHFRLRALFISDNTRQAVNEDRASYIPIFLSDIPALFAPDGGMPIDVALIQVSPPDAHGYCSLGPSVDVTVAAVQYARVVIALVNPRMPRTHGDGFIHISRITRAVSWEGPLYTVERRPLSEEQLAIGRHVASLVEDGATLQMGIGAVPDATTLALLDHRDLGVHTEMFSDGVVDLVEAGVITGARKTRDRGVITAGFVIGSERILRFVDDNPCVSLRTTEYTNNTHYIRQFEGMVAINSAIQVDLTGQVCAESIGSRLYSGVGGQMDFLRGAALAPRGKPVIALPATSPFKGDAAAPLVPAPLELAPVAGKVSRITPMLSPGAAVTSSRAHVHYIVTEYGVAQLHGKDLTQRTRSLIAVAAPEFREPLERAAYALRLLS